MASYCFSILSCLVSVSLRLDHTCVTEKVKTRTKMTFRRSWNRFVGRIHTGWMALVALLPTEDVSSRDTRIGSAGISAKDQK
ncbi:hypothetical protein DFH08DRAFT_835570 [Mycena albidolilacea]|uniref:Secreted protein n=1 Tax=Mycena albidolilacea TaxID=1033008 RepID=A0AAD7F599_9AGAR|nr:hypothetical protein DFH08DRAFT_835570 [Mycena albidolilacea]